VRALLEGILAGLGIAVPVGPIAVLLVDLSMRRGFAPAAPAALGAASADLTYATVAAVLGSAAAAALEPLEEPLRVISVGVLLTIAGVRTWRLFRGADRGASEPIPERRSESRSERRSERGGPATYLAFLGLTLLNPVTVAYFAALILGLQADALTGAGAKAVFVAGAFAASAAWQLTLVGAGAFLHRRLPANAALVTGLAGSVLIVAFAVRLALA
jgi:threonine/homoserine/homoserine lactone efflux protein